MDILLDHLPGILFLSVLGLGAKLALHRKNASKPPFPPSPPSQFIWGHAHRLYQSYGNEEEAAYELGKQCGGIAYLSVFGVPMVVLNDIKIAIDLFSKRGSVFGSRPKITTCMMDMGFTQAITILPYGPDWRMLRRIFQSYYSPSVRPSHQVIQLREARHFLKNVLLAPMSEQGKDWEPETLHFTISVLIATTFGHDIVSEEDPYFKMTDNIVRKVIPAMMPADILSAGLLQVFPLIQYFPSWFPGASVPSNARHVKQFVRTLYEYPIKDVEEKMKTGKARPSFMTTQLEGLENGEIGSGVTLEHIKGTCAAVSTAGIDLTASALLTLVGALLLHPDVQKRAQDEIDRVIGTERLPEFSDREKMPYLQCVVEEAARWQPVASLFPRTSSEDEVYEGMFIPKGTTVVANAKGMCRDENIYKDPFSFNPDRYLPLSEGGNDEPFFQLTFGTGRRICPGRWLAQDAVWILAVHLLATMNVLPVTNEEIRWKFTGAMNRPLPFKCRIVPRSEQARDVIEASDFLEA